MDGSDIDLRGVTLNLPSDLIGLTSFEQYEDRDTDMVVYSFLKLVKLLLECNPNTIEILGLDEYLRLDPIKDVIGWQLDEVLDINGWDMKKTLLAFAKGNPNVMEWATSPIVYRQSELWPIVKQACLGYFSEKASLCHYYGTARNTLEKYLLGEKVR